MQKKDFELSFLDIFRDKGIAASIAEKAVNNLRARENSIYNLHYFTVQHSFKQIDKKQIFVLDEETSQWAEYRSLGFERFKGIKGDLQKLIENLRNINSHYLHFFDFLREDRISSEIIIFLKESFRLAVIQSFINEKISEKAKTQTGKPLTSDEKAEIVKQCLANETEITDFLKTMFYQSFYVKKKEFEQKQEESKERIRHINRMFDTLDNAIDYIFFVNAEEDIKWTLNHAGKGGEHDHAHEMLIIAKGRYLSFNAMLFLFSMFLYKNEANQLIPRISGFKKNGTTEDRRKLNVFLFYAKKFSSQDIDSEHKKLVYFRDIIQYLNKFPLEWNKALEGKESESVKDFKNEIYKMEMEREFKLKDDVKFVDYAFSKFFTTEMDKIELYEMLINKDQSIRKVYADIINKTFNSETYKN